MALWSGIAITVALVAIMVATHKTAYDIGHLNGRVYQKSYNYLETLQQTRQRGTPEQERGSDDTG